MLISTTERIEGKEISETLGLVKGNTIRARWIGRDVAAGLKSLAGGEIKSYTTMLSDAREEAINRMKEEAEKLGANAVVSVRFATSMVMQGSAEMLAYGTAVKVR
jgi:uncharacterized protein YbjQ (UPF0145 family)